MTLFLRIALSALAAFFSIGACGLGALAAMLRQRALYGLAVFAVSIAVVLIVAAGDLR